MHIMISMKCTMNHLTWICLWTQHGCLGGISGVEL